MSITENREVVVVGGGPAGSATASVLARLGHDVLLLDKARFPRPKPCSEYASPGVFEVLGSIGAREAYEAAGPSRLLGMEIHTATGQRLLIEYPGEGPRRYALSMDRARLDALLLGHAGRCGTEVRQGVRVREPVLGDGRVCGVEAELPDGTTRRIDASLVIGADGLHSVVTRRLAGPYTPSWPRRLGLVAHYRGVEWLPPHGEMHVHPLGYCGLAPLPDGCASVGLVLDMRRIRAPGRRSDDLLSYALELFPAMRERLQGARRLGRVTGVGPMARGVRRRSGEGWAVVGDAAGFFDPFTGEGIYRALKGGELLAAAASEALRGGGPTAPALRRYESERSRHFSRKTLVVGVVQLCVSYPRLMEHMVSRLARRPRELGELSAVLGDYADPTTLLRAGYLPRLLAGR